MITFCDIHHHLLYGLDDGAQTREDMERMLQGAYRDYVDTIVATPHCTPGLQEHPLEAARERLEAFAKGTAMKVKPDHTRRTGSP